MCSLALVTDVRQRRFTDQVYTDDDAALITSDAANCPSALIITFDSAAAAVALHTSLVKKGAEHALNHQHPVDVAYERVKSGKPFHLGPYLSSDLAMATA